MKTLIEHFNEMTNNIEIIEEQLELVYQKMVELNIDELKLSRLFTIVFVFSLICFIFNKLLAFSISISSNGVK
jgi:positive regulator of sigma E activity